MLTEEIMQVVIMSFGTGLLAGISVLFISWGIVSVLNIFKKIA